MKSGIVLFLSGKIFRTDEYRFFLLAISKTRKHFQEKVIIRTFFSVQYVIR